MFHFLLMGLSGAFVTGDLFNLFVFFEVLLIASYVLLVHGQGRERFKAGVHYVVLNLVASALFLVGLAADLRRRPARSTWPTWRCAWPSSAPEEAALFKAGALVLLVVFGLKAAIVPLYLWLPGTYAAASAPVAAMFAIMTKVGVYSIIRVHAVILGEGAGHAALAAEPWLLPLALLTIALGVLGALAAHSLARLVSYLTVASVGTILAGVGPVHPGRPVGSAVLHDAQHAGGGGAVFAGRTGGHAARRVRRPAAARSAGRPAGAARAS